MKTRLANILTTIIVLLFTIFCQAQKKSGYIPPSIDDEEIPVVKTELPVPGDGKDYVVQYFKGITDGVESRIAVKKLGYIIRPAMVQVISEDGRELAIELVKKNWDDIVRSGTTKNGTYESSFKTALEFGIKISAQEKGISFIVAVSAGIELFPPTNLFVDAGTKRSSSANEEAVKDVQESGESNNTLYIIISVALIGILVLLAMLVFKKKGKRTASMILFLLFSISADAGLVQGLGNSLSGKATTGLANFLIDSMSKRYGKGGFGGDRPLSEDDRDFEPEPDPRGQPSLPSSCYEVARMSRSEGDVSKGGSSEAKNPTNANGANMTMSTGGVAGAVGGNVTGEQIGHEDGKDKDFAKERQKIQNDFQHYRDLALGRMEQGKMEAQENFNRSLRDASKQFDKDVREANGNDELIAQAAANQANTIAQLSAELSSASSQFDIQYAMDLANLAEDIAYEMSVLAEEEAANDQQQQNNDGGGGEKDPNRLPKKDPAREQGKGVDNGDGSKGVNPTDDSEDGGPNPPTAPTSSNGSNPGRNREQEAGCKCLEEAYANLQKQRYTLERLLKIGQHTKKVTDFGISFGDDFSGVHGVSGLAWQTQRAKVLKSIDQFDITYNNKYKELIDALYNALIQIDECETNLGYENWYSQSGFIYYEFMKVRYASYK